MKSIFLAKCLKYFYKFKKKHIIIVCIKLILLCMIAVLLADYRAEPEPDRPPFRTTRRGFLRKTASTSAKPATQSTTGQADTNKQNPSVVSAPASVPNPFNYSSESLNQSHADLFKDWIDSKSTELYELSLNYSGFKLLNATYNVQLRKDAKFAWINFTEMIINISQTISQVLHHKTLIVKNLTDMVEQTFEEYRGDSARVKQSASYAYYDAKSPKTFCDVQKAASNNSIDAEEEMAASGSVDATTEPVNVTRKQRVNKQKMNKSSVSDESSVGFRKRHSVKLDDEMDLFDLIDDELAFDYMPRQIGQVKRHVHNESSECPMSGIVHGHVKVAKRSVNRENGARKGKFRRPGLVRRPKNQTTTKAATTTAKSAASDYYYDFMEKNNDLDSYDYTAVEFALKETIPFWNVSCINRTYDENFKAFKKGVSRNKSTIHVPTNVYRQDLDINMTAYWTEDLDRHFKKNYDQDNEIFWQYFCSSNGLYRRFPGAYWNVPIYEDFFDCRLQSWYIMAAASSKDVLILLDVSGSMTGLKLEIAKKLIEAIMDTLSDNDFFNILLFSDEVRFLMDKANETHYSNRFVQAGRTNKKSFIDRLKIFKNTDNVADVVKGLTKSFELLLSKDLKTDTCGCNKVIMLLTDGISENAEQVFRKYNWENGRQVRVFTYLIGREMTDSRHLEWMACANDGHYFHVATLADINEHVHEYIPVLSRPMALAGRHETTWSNVFIGHLDKELKIAVARPAFKTKSSLLSKTDLLKRDDDYFRNLLQTESTTTKLQLVENANYDPDYYYYYYEYEDDPVDQLDAVKPTVDETDEEDAEEAEARDIEILKKTYDIIRNQDVLLGVVGVDVPVLKLISKVSPKYQMGVGIYIIMLDNNGFIVFHPSIKKEITNNFNVKGTSNSIDMDRFEIPIDNGEEFEMLEHEMIDQKTGNKTLNNWKREGLRVIRRRTEYVYTSVERTPFSVAIASPSSFGRYYIDLPSKKERDYEQKLEHLVHNNFETLIQIYNCTYNYSRLIEKLLHPKQYMDFCIRYLFHDPDQVLAIKSDLVFHDIYSKQYNFSMHLDYPNLVKSSFYGTYSGITFFMPVTFYRSHQGLTVAQLLHNNYTFKSNMAAAANHWSHVPQATAASNTWHTEPQTEMTMNVQLGFIVEPLFKTSTKSAINATNLTNSNGVYRDSVNLLSTDSNKHTYSFEKQFYTRSIEFSDYLRTEFNMNKPMVNYFLNESSREVRRDTIGATLSIWLDKVPTAVTGVMYDAHLFQYFLFENYMRPGCDHATCRNLCSLKRAMNLSCYLVDEHGIVVMSTQERVSRQIKEPIGQPLYKVNPWLMKILEFEGIYDLVIPGKQLPECRQQSRIFNSSSRLANALIFVFKLVLKLLGEVSVMLLFGSGKPVSSQLNPTLSLADHIRIFNNEWRGKNSHCYNFGVYSFNLTKWNGLDASQLRVWCNSTNNTQRKFLVGPVKHSNLIMLVVEEEFELIHCGNLSQLISNYQSVPEGYNFGNESTVENGTAGHVAYSNVTGVGEQEFSINRYRNKPEQCHNYFQDEKEYLPCFNNAKLYTSTIALIQMIRTKMIKHNLLLSLLICSICSHEASNNSLSDDPLSSESLDLEDEYYSGETEKAVPARLNATHAHMFKNWIDTKSDSLFQLSMNFSGYNLLNETYNVHLRRDAKFSWINFTEMIVNISDTISEVMYDKTLVVKNLSDLVEKSYDEFITDADKVINSTSHVYLDSKSPKTFCDVSETYKQKIAEKKKPNTKSNRTQKRSVDRFIDQDELIFYPNQTLRVQSLKSSFVRPTRLFNVTRAKKYTTPSTTVPFYPNDEEYNLEDELEDELDDEMDNYDLNDEYWDVECINRTYDENFKSVQKINKNESTIQVPINVYKQEIAINMTAYWTEALDTQFKQNYKQDSDLFWQYFCSSNGLFRRYPAAYWSAPDDDFFDCRLQSWYIMAAASPKDALILLDVSGSMTGLRLEIAKRLIDFILDTFTDNDFFNVLTFSNTVHYLFDNEPDYQNTFVQAGKANKLKFKEKLATYKNTSQQGRLSEPLTKVFHLFNERDLVRSRCNKMIMIITDGHADDVDPIFAEHNGDKRVRVFSFKIGRDMSDPSHIKKLACNNNGEYYHVVTLTDINEHVYEYIPVLSRPMALSGVRETTWSNVFIGYLDNELKIAVARPAFRTLHYNFSRFKLNRYLNKSIDFKVDNYEQIVKKNRWSHGFYLTSEEQREAIESAEKEVRGQDVFLGVVGVDVPVLKLISKVSPKYQMGVGIYIIMLDNNGFIVFHPSIKKEISESQYDYKGTSHSIEMEKFEIPIGNEYEFEMLEHDMIDQKTGNTTLNNWKREGLRVIRRRTEYVYTSVEKTPFTVAIASPSSFGRYYIDLPTEREKYYDETLTNLIKNKSLLSIDTNIQLYNCSYSYFKLTERLMDPSSNSDFCIRYLFKDYDQALAIKSDLTIHNIYYHKFNFSIFSQYQNLIRSTFYGTYSGTTFYLPVTFYREKTDHSDKTPSSKGAQTEAYKMSLNLFGFDSNKHTYSFEKQYYTRSIEFSDYLRTQFSKTNDPVIIYFLNETSTGSINPTINETISAAIPLWLDKVPAAVAGVVYDSQKLQEVLFYTPPDCQGDLCINICNRTSDLKLSCYLVDEHGFVVLTNTEQYSAIGQPLYKVNPWLMLQLEFEGLFDLIVTGNKLQECNKPPISLNSAAGLFSLLKMVAKTFGLMATGMLNLAVNGLYALSGKVNAQTAEEIDQIEWRIQNSHCFYFGIYSFNLSKWQSRDAESLRPWCNSSDGQHKQYLAGYLQKSNLIMVVAEDENQVSKCGSIETLSKNRPPAWNSVLTNSANSNVSNIKKKYSINRYRKNPDYCHNYFANESDIFFCKSSSVVSFKTSFFYLLIRDKCCIFLFSQLIFYFF